MLDLLGLWVPRPWKGRITNGQAVIDIVKPGDTEVWQKLLRFLTNTSPTFLQNDNPMATWNMDGTFKNGRLE